jgi:2-desacetyl-2-hydroxyethyl bacteriochlorophyllide A dehydrogenase
MDSMKAALLERQGAEGLVIREILTPEPGPHEVLLRVTLAAINPVDHFVVQGTRPVPRLPHVPGAEFTGVVEKVGEHVDGIRPGERAAVYNRIHDGTCAMCVKGMEMLCPNGGIMGVVSWGGFSEFVVLPSRNVLKLPDGVSEEMAASLPVAALTAYHALMEAKVGPGTTVVVVGASGNTGMFAVQLAKLMGATVLAASRRDWPRELGADLVFRLEEAAEKVSAFTGGRMADVVIDPLGARTFESSLQLLGLRGKFVTFGVLTGAEVRVSLSSLYNRHISLLGVTGGTKAELVELIRMAAEGKLAVKVWRVYPLEQVRAAIEALFDVNRNGRILLKVGT